MSLTIVAISDTHGRHRELTVPPGDLLLFAGDLSNHGFPEDITDFNDWLGSLPHPHKVMICGNHDFHFERDPADARRRITHATYLQDSGVEVCGLRIWGSPWQPRFFDWAFNLDRGPEIAAKWALIPDDTDVLITHGPPAGILDKTSRGEATGCVDLLWRLQELKPQLHLFGHIHEAAGVVQTPDTLFVNASIGIGNRVGRGPVVLTWEGQRFTAR
ncbi:MAG: metallophosphatase domain-containing protein [Fimbriiglobus sp.]|nr:metallophosphatase domain-containing protein [Fimbriiglobus sp.]